MRTPIVCAIAISSILCGVAHGTMTTAVTVTETSLATLNDATEVDYVVVQVPIPELPASSEIVLAYLEFYMDASSTLEEGTFDGFVTLEVFPYPELANGKLDAGELPSPVTKCTVPVGNDRPVRAYVTSALLKAIAESESEVGLLVGSVTGARTARFDAKAVPGAPGGAKAVLKVFLCHEDNPNG